MTSAELIKRLESEGWFWAGGKGDHRKYKHPSKPGYVTIPHPRKDLAIRTLRNIYRQAGWNWR
jgi:predicted RNA binding protein YcfA (HicA-like mRNA interferase family)